MVKIKFDDVPLSFEHLAQQVVELSEFIEEKNALENSSSLVDDLKVLTVSYIGDEKGYVLFSVPEVDLWYTYTPHKTWMRCSVAYDAVYEQKVLVEKYNMMKLFEIEIKFFKNRKLPIYIKRPSS